MTEPRRIQMKRSRGWRKPDNTVYVGRPTIFGNPFHPPIDGNKEWAADRFRAWITQAPHVYVEKWALIRTNLDQLRGKNLACWCKEGDRCHADVLLELAKETQEEALTRLAKKEKL